MEHSKLHVGSIAQELDKTSRTERVNSGNQCNRNLKMVRKGRQDNRPIVYINPMEMVSSAPVVQ